MPKVCAGDPERLAERGLGVALVVSVAAGQQAASRGHVVLARLVVLLGNIALGLGHAGLLLRALERILVPPRAKPVKERHPQYVNRRADLSTCGCQNFGLAASDGLTRTPP